MVLDVEVGEALSCDLIQRSGAGGLSVRLASLTSDNRVESFVGQPGALGIRFKSAAVLPRGHETVVVNAESRALVRRAERLRSIDIRSGVTKFLNSFKNIVKNDKTDL